MTGPPKLTVQSPYSEHPGNGSEDSAELEARRSLMRMDAKERSELGVKVDTAIDDVRILAGEVRLLRADLTTDRLHAAQRLEADVAHRRFVEGALRTLTDQVTQDRSDAAAGIAHAARVSGDTAAAVVDVRASLSEEQMRDRLRDEAINARFTRIEGFMRRNRGKLSGAAVGLAWFAQHFGPDIFRAITGHH